MAVLIATDEVGHARPTGRVDAVGASVEGMAVAHGRQRTSDASAGFRAYVRVAVGSVA